MTWVRNDYSFILPVRVNKKNGSQVSLYGESDISEEDKDFRLPIKRQSYNNALELLVYPDTKEYMDITKTEMKKTPRLLQQTSVQFGEILSSENNKFIPLTKEKQQVILCSPRLVKVQNNNPTTTSLTISPFTLNNFSKEAQSFIRQQNNQNKILIPDSKEITGNKLRKSIQKKSKSIIEQNQFKFSIDSFLKQKSALKNQYERMLTKFNQIISLISQYPFSIKIQMETQVMYSCVHTYCMTELIQFKNIEKKQISTQQIKADSEPALIKKYLVAYDFINKNLSHNKIITQENVTLKKYKNCVYFGNINKEGKKQGFGILIYFSGKVFEGEFRNDLKFYGLEMKQDSTEIYLGRFLQGIREDDHGILLGNQMIYYGRFIKGNWQGNGFILQQNLVIFDYYKICNQFLLKNLKNDVFIGNIEDELKTGFGMEKFGNGDFFLGNYRQSKPDGYGEYYEKNGSVYQGNFFFGKRHGFGKFSVKEGDSYQGQYMNDKKCGEGCYRWPDGSYYRGQFQNDCRHGKGQMNYYDGNVSQGYWILDIQKKKQKFQSPESKSPITASKPKKKSIYVKSIKIKSHTLDYKGNSSINNNLIDHQRKQSLKKTVYANSYRPYRGIFFYNNDSLLLPARTHRASLWKDPKDYQNGHLIKSTTTNNNNKF